MNEYNKIKLSLDLKDALSDYDAFVKSYLGNNIDQCTIEDIFSKILLTCDKIIPDSFPKEIKIIFSSSIRNVYVKYIGFTIIERSWVSPLSKIIGNRKVLEVMAGSGALSLALEKEGVDIISTDNMTWYNKYDKWNLEDSYHYIEFMNSIEAVEKYGKECEFLLMSWPYMDDTAYMTIKKYREINPNGHFIYIGEEYGGCTANDEFFDYMENFEESVLFRTENAYSNEMNEIRENYKSWYGIYDHVNIYF